MSKLDNIFDSVSQRNLFKNKQFLQSNYSPNTIPHRDEQIEAVASILAPALLGQKTSNLFIYGKTGSGKTLSVYHVANELSKRAAENKILRIEYINCKLKKVADTEYRILAKQIILVGISNDLRFLDMIDQRVRSSLSEEEIVFPPYNALQLQDILKKRAEDAFKEKLLSGWIIPKRPALGCL